MPSTPLHRVDGPGNGQTNLAVPPSGRASIGHRRLHPSIARRTLADVPEDVRASVDAINVSYRVNRRASGSLHKDSFYSKPHPAVAENGKEVPYRHIRKRLKMISQPRRSRRSSTIGCESASRPTWNDSAAISRGHLVTRRTIRYFKTCRRPESFPSIKPRIRKNEATIDVGAAEKQRHVAPGLNHHMEIVAALDDQRDRKSNGKATS